MAIAQRADEAVADLVRWWAGEDARLRERFGANTYGLRTSEEIEIEIRQLKSHAYLAAI